MKYFELSKTRIYVVAFFINFKWLRHFKSFECLWEIVKYHNKLNSWHRFSVYRTLLRWRSLVFVWRWEWCRWAQTMESLFGIIIWCGFISAMERVTIQVQVDGITTHKTSKLKWQMFVYNRTTQIHLSHIFNLQKIVFLSPVFLARFSGHVYSVYVLFTCVFITLPVFFPLRFLITNCLEFEYFLTFFSVVSFHIFSSRVSFFSLYTVADYFSILRLLNDDFMDASMTSSV